MTYLKELIERVEKATGPDRELDRDIGLALDGWRIEPGSNFDASYIGNMIMDADANLYPDHPGSMYPSFTESIDAALALTERMLPGKWWLVLDDAATYLWATRQTANPPISTLPLAIVLATLRALTGAREMSDYTEFTPITVGTSSAAPAPVAVEAVAWAGSHGTVTDDWRRAKKWRDSFGLEITPLYPASALSSLEALSDAIIEKNDEITRLRQRVEEQDAALEPFAKWPDSTALPDDAAVWTVTFHSKERNALKVGDFRAARRARKEPNNV